MRNALLVIVVAALGCGGAGGDFGGGPGTPGDVYSPIGLPGAPGNNSKQGYLDTGLPDGWNYPFGARFSGGRGQDQECVATGRCGFGGLSGAGYGTLPTDGGKIVFVSTKNFTDTDVAAAKIVVVTSAIQRDSLALSTANPSKKLRLSFDYAFLLSRDAPGDSVVVQLVAASGTATTLFRRTRAELGASVPLRSGGCGASARDTVPKSTYETRSDPVTYATCTDWTHAEADLTSFRGQTVSLRFLVGESGPKDPLKSLTFLVRKVEVQEAR